MAIQIVPILKTLAPLVANASGIVASLKSAKETGDTEERLRRLEQEAIEAGELLSATTKQLQALAKQLKVQAELNEEYERKTKRAVVLASVATVVALIAVGIAIWA